MRSCTKLLETLTKKLFLTFILLALAALATVAVGMPRGAQADPAIDGEEQAFLTLINNHRTQNGLGTLSLNTQLTNSSDWMSNDMATNNYFSHTDSLGRDPFQRMAAFGYDYNTWKGENLAAGADTAQGAFNLWKNSAGHNANMLNANFKVIGIARVYGAGSTYGWYWTTDFGGQGSAPPPAEPTTPAVPTTPPPPPPPPVPTPQPTQPPPAETPPPPEPTPEPTPDPTPDPTPVLPNRDDIQSQLSGVWQRLNVVGVENSVLRHVSYVAERYLLARDGLLVQDDGRDSDVRVADVRTGELWLAIFKG